MIDTTKVKEEQRVQSTFKAFHLSSIIIRALCSFSIRFDYVLSNFRFLFIIANYSDECETKSLSIFQVVASHHVRKVDSRENLRFVL